MITPHIKRIEFDSEGHLLAIEFFENGLANAEAALRLGLHVVDRRSPNSQERIENTIKAALENTAVKKAADDAV